ncbi:hypothetical protein FRY74_04545 [Vicingus serpentipes]|uniref:Uncharacterized protein n=1 Tax=Vicingus serpentipes TaxID=1926625 RepID=A0A5C6RWW6_9FLAO|nr:hypothetical protein [Vicingus serpentipes]TXB65842.1 hypothetical protein FRY74_04545 [Vicingus serpentipes]
MLKIFIPTILVCILTISCNKNNCKECTGCKDLPNATLCEDDFEKSSDYNDQVDNYVSNGCNCKDK